MSKEPSLQYGDSWVNMDTGEALQWNGNRWVQIVPQKPIRFYVLTEDALESIRSLCARCNYLKQMRP